MGTDGETASIETIEYRKIGLKEECIKRSNNIKMTLQNALEIAKESKCVEKGVLKDEYSCNEETGTWWIGLTVEDKLGCNPACVVDIDTRIPYINWRCTGLIPQ